MKHDLNGDFGRCAMTDRHETRPMVPRYADVDPADLEREKSTLGPESGPSGDDTGSLRVGDGPGPKSPLCAPLAGLTPAMVRALERKLHELVADPCHDNARALHRETLEVLEALRLLRKYGALEDQGIGLSDKVGYR